MSFLSVAIRIGIYDASDSPACCSLINRHKAGDVTTQSFLGRRSCTRHATTCAHFRTVAFQRQSQCATFNFRALDSRLRLVVPPEPLCSCFDFGEYAINLNAFAQRQRRCNAPLIELA